jgi:hypothetical protein
MMNNDNVSREYGYKRSSMLKVRLNEVELEFLKVLANNEEESLSQATRRLISEKASQYTDK